VQSSQARPSCRGYDRRPHEAVETQTERVAANGSRIVPSAWFGSRDHGDERAAHLAPPGRRFPPQLWAEDGGLVRDAYNHGALRACSSRATLFATLSRLVAAVSLWVPLLRFPSCSISALWPSKPFRLCSWLLAECGMSAASSALRVGVAVSLVPDPSKCMPLSRTHNRNWRSCLLVIVAEAPRSRWGKTFDCCCAGAMCAHHSHGMSCWRALPAPCCRYCPSIGECRTCPSAGALALVQLSLLTACALARADPAHTAGPVSTRLWRKRRPFARIVAGKSFCLPSWNNRLYR